MNWICRCKKTFINKKFLIEHIKKSHKDTKVNAILKQSIKGRF